MKNHRSMLFAAPIIIALTSLSFKGGDEIKTLEIGEKAPLTDIKMKDVSGGSVSLKDKMDANGLLVIFSCNTCPFVIGRGSDSEGWEGRYNDVAAVARENKVGVILINSNEAKRTSGDGFDDMVKRAQEKKYTMSYVEDANHVMADAFGARTTPHVFLFNKNFDLVYKGAVDDNGDAYADVKEPWLKNAMTHLAAGEDIDPNTTKNLGCSIKRVVKE